MELGHSADISVQTQTRLSHDPLPNCLYQITLLNLPLNSHPFPDPLKDTLWSAHVNHGSAVTKQRSDNLRELRLFETGTRRHWTRWPWDLWENTRETQWSPTLRYDSAYGQTHIRHIAHMHKCSKQTNSRGNYKVPAATRLWNSNKKKYLVFKLYPCKIPFLSFVMLLNFFHLCLLPKVSFVWPWRSQPPMPVTPKKPKNHKGYCRYSQYSTPPTNRQAQKLKLLTSYCANYHMFPYS